jgi:FkbM family methyltransferase
MIVASTRRFIQGRLPFLVKIMRWLIAYRDALLSARDSYSKFGEDRTIWNLLRPYDLSTGIYVDVGANQPTKISNTYLFYRKGYRGVVIEPNRDLVALFKRFRRRDIAIPVGCGDRSSVLEFKYSKASVFSTFSDCVIEGAMSAEYLPVLRLDDILAGIPYGWIFYLSIDAEGFDFAVLRGAPRTLGRVLFVTVEYKSDESNIEKFMRNSGFQLVSKTGENLIFKSHRDFSQFSVDEKSR